MEDDFTVESDKEMYLVKRILSLDLKTVSGTDGSSNWDNETRSKESLKLPVEIYC